MPCASLDEDSDLPELVNSLVSSYRGDHRAHHINRRFLPSREEIIEIVSLLLQLMYPGYHGRQDLTDQNISYHVGVLLTSLRQKLIQQTSLCLCFASELQGPAPSSSNEHRADARTIATQFLHRLPTIRATLITDVQAAYDGDPAAVTLDEIILSYPGLLAVSVYRLAHEIHRLGVPLMPRIMTEWAHAQTGADIHPGAEIGPSFFLDHATGVVIGETTKIGANVKLYQGVTLGALSHPRDESGRVIRGTKRHPTVDDHVTIYANATVLGGTTTLGEGTIVGGSVFLTQSVPPRSRVAAKLPELQVRTAPRSGEAAPTAEDHASNGAAPPPTENRQATLEEGLVLEAG